MLTIHNSSSFSYSGTMQVFWVPALGVPRMARTNNKARGRRRAAEAQDEIGRPAETETAQGPAQFVGDLSGDEGGDEEQGDEDMAINVQAADGEVPGALQPELGPPSEQAGAGKPLILFDVNGVLVTERANHSYRTEWPVRPGIALLLLLLPKFRLGVFSSAKSYNIKNAIKSIFMAVCQGRKEVDTEQFMGITTKAKSKKKRTVPPGISNAKQLFSVVMSRDHCQLDASWKDRPGGNAWDTVKPLAGNGLTLGQVLLVDNELRKVLPEERDSAIAIPTWETAPDEGLASWETLIRSLLALPDGADLRSHSARITAEINPTHTLSAAPTGGTAQAQPMARPPGSSTQGTTQGTTSGWQPASAAGTSQAPSQQQGQLQSHGHHPEHPPSQPPAAKRRRVDGTQDVAEAAAAAAKGGDWVDEDEGDREDEGEGGEGWGRGGAASCDAGGGALVNGSGSDEDDSDDDSDEEEEDDLEGEGDITLHTAAEEEAGPLDGMADGPAGPSEHAQQPPNPVASEEGANAAQAQGDAHIDQQAWTQPVKKRGYVRPGAQPLYNGPRATPPSGVAPAAHQHHHQRQQPRMTTLHYEVAGFASAAAPGPQDLEAVAAAIHAVQTVVSQLWPGARVVLFGSQACGLALPGSDLDLVVLGAMQDVANPEELAARKSEAQTCLAGLIEALRNAGALASAELIRAKVPIIKARVLTDLLDTPGGMFSSTASGSFPSVGRGSPAGRSPHSKRGRGSRPSIAVDISIGAWNGAEAVTLMQSCVRRLPPLRPLLLVLKALLREAGLNEVFSGGLSSYSLFSMVLAHLQCEGYEQQVAAAVAAADAEVSAARKARKGAAGGIGLVNADATDVGSKGAGGGQPQGSPGAGLAVQVLGPKLHSFLQGLYVPDSQLTGCSGGIDLGHMLCSLLQRYGHVVDWARDQVSVRRGGIVAKDGGWKHRPHQAHVGPLLCIEDPQMPGRDIAVASVSSPLVGQALRLSLLKLSQDSGTPWQQDPLMALNAIIHSQNPANLGAKVKSAGKGQAKLPRRRKRGMQDVIEEGSHVLPPPPRSVAELIAAVVNSGLGHVVARSGQGAAFRSKEWPMLAFADKALMDPSVLLLPDGPDWGPHYPPGTAGPNGKGVSGTMTRAGIMGGSWKHRGRGGQVAAGAVVPGDVDTSELGLWAAVQADGASTTPAVQQHLGRAAAPQGGSPGGQQQLGTTAGGAGGRAYQNDLLLPRLFDVAQALARSHQQAQRPGGHTGGGALTPTNHEGDYSNQQGEEGPIDMDAEEAARAARLDDALEAERMGIDRTMNKRQQKIQAAKVRRLLARSEQIIDSISRKKQKTADAAAAAGVSSGAAGAQGQQGEGVAGQESGAAPGSADLLSGPSGDASHQKESGNSQAANQDQEEEEDVFHEGSTITAQTGGPQPAGGVVAQGLALMATALSKAGAPNASTLARHLYNYLRLGDKARRHLAVRAAGIKRPESLGARALGRKLRSILGAAAEAQELAGAQQYLEEETSYDKAGLSHQALVEAKQAFLVMKHKLLVGAHKAQSSAKKGAKQGAGAGAGVEAGAPSGGVDAAGDGEAEAQGAGTGAGVQAGMYGQGGVAQEALQHQPYQHQQQHRQSYRHVGGQQWPPEVSPKRRRAAAAGARNARGGKQQQGGNQHWSPGKNKGQAARQQGRFGTSAGGVKKKKQGQARQAGHAGNTQGGRGRSNARRGGGGGKSRGGWFMG